MQKDKISALVREKVYQAVRKQKKFVIAANWKMNMTSAETEHYLEVLNHYDFSDRNPVILFPPSPYLYLMKKFSGPHIQYGTQNVYFAEKGAFTGEVSTVMAKDLGCAYSILGHSERRNIFGETDELIGKKVKACFKAGIRPVLCIGEKLEERRSGQYAQVLRSQLKNALADTAVRDAEHLLVAYEPVWAIGTGESAAPDQIEETHRFIREQLVSIFGADSGREIPILYGGSVNPDNIEKTALCEEVSGFLIGGAALDAGRLMQMMDVFNEKKP